MGRHAASTDVYYRSIVLVVGHRSGAWVSWLRSWQRSLHARDLSPKPVSLYLSAAALALTATTSHRENACSWRQ